MFGAPVDGRSLMPLARGEYCAEMTGHLVFMIRRGDLKYIYCDSTPPQFYDLYNDPWECVNLVGESAYADIVDGFAKEAEKRWDSDVLRQKLLTAKNHALR